MMPVEKTESIKCLLIDQLEFLKSEFLHAKEPQILENILGHDQGEEIEGYKAYENVDEFGTVVKKLLALRDDIESE